MEARNLGVKIKTNQKVQRVFKEQDIWKVQVEGWIYEGEAVILSNGSKASAISGSDGSGYELAAALGHRLIEPLPALTALKCRNTGFSGWAGVRTLAETIRYAQSKGMFVMTDGKRNDIGATMTAYATAHLGKVDVDGVELEPFGADALTVNGYLGTDGIQPLLDVCEKYDKGIFVLAKTSNPSSGELQDRLIDGKPVYEIMGEMCENWGSRQIGAYGYSAVGAVVGATYPEQLAELRKKLPHTLFLVPGYGAQGGQGKDRTVVHR